MFLKQKPPTKLVSHEFPIHLTYLPVTFSFMGLYKIVQAKLQQIPPDAPAAAPRGKYISISPHVLRGIHCVYQ